MAQESKSSGEIYRHLAPSKRTGETVNIAALNSSGLSAAEAEAYLYWRFLASEDITANTTTRYGKQNPVEKYDTDSASILTKIFMKFAKVRLAGLVFYSGSASADEKSVSLEKIQENLKEAKDEISKLKDSDFETYAYLISDCAISCCLYGFVEDGQKLLFELDESTKGIAHIATAIDQSAFERILLDRIEFSMRATWIDTHILGQARRRYVAHKHVFSKRFEVTANIIKYAQEKIPSSSDNYPALEEYRNGSNQLQNNFSNLLESEAKDKITTEGMLILARLFAATVDDVVEDQINARRYSWEKPYRASGDNAVELFSNYYNQVQADLDKEFYGPSDYRVVFVW